MSEITIKHRTSGKGLGQASEFLFAYPNRCFGGMCLGCGPYLGVGYVLAYGGYRPEQARIYLSDNRVTWEEMADNICSLAIKGVGFSVYESNYVFVSDLATRIRKIKPSLLIVCGGPCSTFSARRMLAHNPAIDLCVLGEAELTFKRLVESGLSRDVWPEIPGLAFREDGVYRETEHGHQHYLNDSEQDTLSGLPSPYLAGVVPPSAAAELGVATSRGCPRSCTFCSFAAIGKRMIRFFPESQVIEELRLICRHFAATRQPVTISFNDDNFTVRIKRAKRILKALQSFRPENVSFSFMSRPDDVRDAEFLELARAAAVTEIGFGLESAAPDVLSLVKKVRPNRQEDLSKERQYIQATREAIQTTVHHGIDATVSIILGLPGDTMERGAETLACVNDLPVTAYYHNVLKIYDGTELAWDHEKYGLKRLDREDSPFPMTQHTYDVQALPIMPHAVRAREYMGQSMASALYGLTGLAACDVLPGYACLYLDVDPQREPLDWEHLPIGTVFIEMPGVRRNNIWRRRGFGSSVFQLTSRGCLLNRDIFSNSPFLPVFIFPGNTIQTTEACACLEFIDMDPIAKIPSSERNHWRLPYAACGLLPTQCPARSGRLRSQTAECGLCIFHTITMDDCERPSQCTTCQVNDTCPKCPYLLQRFGEVYCEHHRSERPQSLLAYLRAHVHVLNAPGTRLNALPSIRLENYDIRQTNVRAVSINDELILVYL